MEEYHDILFFKMENESDSETQSVSDEKQENRIPEFPIREERDKHPEEPVKSKKVNGIARICMKCGKTVDRMAQHLIRKHPHMTKEERAACRREMVTKIARICMKCGKTVDRMAEHLIRKHPHMTKEEWAACRREMLIKTPIITSHAKHGEKRLPLKPCPICKGPVQRLDNHLHNKHGVPRKSQHMMKLLDSNYKPDLPVEVPKPTRDNDGDNTAAIQTLGSLATGSTSMLLDKDLEEPVKSRKANRIARICIKCGETVKNMSRHLMRRHPNMTKDDRAVCRREMLTKTPIVRVPHAKLREKRRTLKACPLCDCPVQRLDNHLHNKHGVPRNSQHMLKLLDSNYKPDFPIEVPEPASNDDRDNTAAMRTLGSLATGSISMLLESESRASDNRSSENAKSEAERARARDEQSKETLQKILRMEEERLAVEKQRLVIERERLRLERYRVRQDERRHRYGALHRNLRLDPERQRPLFH